VPTCDGRPTCNNEPTCGGVQTCQLAPSCAGLPTCNGQPTCRFSPTCDGWPTCQTPGKKIPRHLDRAGNGKTIEVDSWHWGDVNPMLFDGFFDITVDPPDPVGSFFDVFFDVFVKGQKAGAVSETLFVDTDYDSTDICDFRDMDQSGTYTPGDFVLICFTYPPELDGESAWYMIMRTGATGTLSSKGAPPIPILELEAGIPPEILSCACDCHADPQCDGSTDILDVVNTVNVAFRGFPAIPDPNAMCQYETTDTDCNGFPDVIDVVHMVNVAFRGFNPATEFCNPCP
jgi:hypothetical protein